jgi:hypothetical protein
MLLEQFLKPTGTGQVEAAKRVGVSRTPAVVHTQRNARAAPFCEQTLQGH